MTADRLAQALERILTHDDFALDARIVTEAEQALAAYRSQSPAEGDAMLTEEQIDRFIPERIGVRNWGKPEQADLFNRGQVRDAIRTAIASQPNVQPKAAEVDAAPWSKTVESAALLLQRCTGLELQDCENLAGTILGMAANVQPKGTAAAAFDDLRHQAMRALVAWDGTVLPKAHDGLMQERMECLRAALEAAQAPAEGDADRHRLDFIQANPNLTLRYYKRHWSLAGVTSYEHRVFKTVREAIDHAMNGGKDD